MTSTKAPLLIAIFAFAIIFCAGIASAAGIQVSAGSIALGGTSQQRGETISGTITITNNLSTTIDSITANKVADGKYNLTVIGIPASLAPGAQASITIQSFVPWDKSTGVETIGSISFAASGSATSPAVTVTLDARNTLRIRTAELIIDEDSTSVKRDGDDVDVKPGDLIRLEIEVENDGPRDVDFDDVNVDVRSDGDVDVDESDSISSLDEGDSDTVVMEFTVPDDAENDDTLTITAEATDEKGATMTVEWDVELNIDRETHLIEIQDLSVNPTSVACSGTQKTTATISIKNTGLRDENEVTVELKARDLDYFKRVINIELDQDKKTTKTFDIPLIGVGAGEYLIEASVYYDNNALTDTGATSVTIRPCTTTPVPPTPSTPPASSNQSSTPSGSQGSIIVGQPSAPFVNPPYLGETEKTSVVNADTLYIVILALIAILILVAIIALIVKFLL